MTPFASLKSAPASPERAAVTEVNSGVDDPHMVPPADGAFAEERSDVCTPAADTAKQSATEPLSRVALDFDESETERLRYLAADDAIQYARMHSTYSERLVLFFLLRGEDEMLVQETAGLLGPSEFGDPIHRNLYAAWQRLYQSGQPCDAAALIHATGVDARHRDDPTVFAGGEEFILDLAQDTGIAAHTGPLQAAVMRIKELALKRGMRRAARHFLDTLERDSMSVADSCTIIDDMVQDARGRLSDSRNEPQHVAVFAGAVLAEAEKVLQGVDLAPGVSTGLRDLDRIVDGGFKDEDFIVLGGRPSQGKTALAINFLLQCAYDARPALMFSLEMRGAAIAKRALSRLSGISSTAFRNAADVSHFMGAMQAQLEAISQIPLFIDESPALSINEIRARTRLFARQFGKPGLIVVDYLQIIANPHSDSGGGQDRQRALVADASRALKNLAREIRCPVMALAQLNRSLEARADKRPVMSDLKESSQIEQDADVIMFVYRDEYYNPETEDRGVTEIIVAKNREGVTGTAKVSHDLATSLYQDGEPMSSRY